MKKIKARVKAIAEVEMVVWITESINGDMWIEDVEDVEDVIDVCDVDSFDVKEVFNEVHI